MYGGARRKKKKSHRKKRSPRRTHHKKHHHASHHASHHEPVPTRNERIDTVLHGAQAAGFKVSRSWLVKRMSQLQGLLQHSKFTAQLGQLGRDYQEADSDLRDAWHGASLIRMHGHDIELTVPRHGLAILRDIIKSTSKAVMEQLDERGDKFYGTILQPLPARRDMRLMAKQMGVLKEQIGRFNQLIGRRVARTQNIDPAGEGEEAVETVEWDAMLHALGVIARIGRTSISPVDNARTDMHLEELMPVYSKGDLAFAETIACGISLRVGMLTCLKLFHLIRELTHGGEHDVQQAAEAEDQEPLPEPSALVSPLGNTFQDVKMERSMRLMMNLAFRGGFGGVMWIFPGDATVREAAEAATERRWMPYVKRRLRRARKWVKSPVTYAVGTMVISLIMSLLPLGRFIGNPQVLFAVTMFIQSFLGAVLTKSLQS